MSIVIIKYNAGNVQSVLYALERFGATARVTDDHDEIRTADKVIFPGVGNAGSAMESLKEKNLDLVIKKLSQPLLGICVGMQLLCDHSEEDNTTCLEIINLKARRFISEDRQNKVPHVGWNTISNFRSPLLKGINEDAYVYYVHSFYVTTGPETVATTDYILPYSAVIQKNNFYGVQFHTEKSAEVGDRILMNFLNL